MALGSDGTGRQGRRASARCVCLAGISCAPTKLKGTPAMTPHPWPGHHIGLCRTARNSASSQIQPHAPHPNTGMTRCTHMRVLSRHGILRAQSVDLDLWAMKARHAAHLRARPSGTCSHMQLKIVPAQRASRTHAGKVLAEILHAGWGAGQNLGKSSKNAPGGTLGVMLGAGRRLGQLLANSGPNRANVGRTWPTCVRLGGLLW